ncbi:hypothetical protein ABTZ98_04310, partial [Streptomyces bacillaris]
LGLLVGLCIAPALISGYTLVESLVPARRVRGSGGRERVSTAFFPFTRGVIGNLFLSIRFDRLCLCPTPRYTSAALPVI